MIASSICIPIVLGSKVISTPAPNRPTEEHDVKRIINIILIIFFYFLIQGIFDIPFLLTFSVSKIKSTVSFKLFFLSIFLLY